MNEKICQIVSDLAEAQIVQLEELSSGYLMSDLLKCIDPKFFGKKEKLSDWYKIKQKVEQFLSLNGIYEELDIDPTGIHQKNFNSIISALF